MVLITAVITGLLAGSLRAWINKRRLTLPDLKIIWLVPVAYLPQWIAFQFPMTRKMIPDSWAGIALVGSQVLLLVFAWSNWRAPGFWMLGLGLVLNLLVISLNGGLMPISPDTVAHLALKVPSGTWQVGNRLGTSKDIILSTHDTHFWWLSDCLFLAILNHTIAFSIGDLFIGAGIIYFLWTLGRKP